MLKRESRIKSNENKIYINSLIKELEEVGEDVENEKDKRNEIKIKIEKFYKNKLEGIKKRVRDDRLKFINAPSKVLIEKELRKGKENRIKYFTDENSKDLENENEIISNIYSFYDNLIGKEKGDENLVNNYNFKIKRLGQVDNNIYISNEITFDEAYEVVKKMKESSPGPNGLTVGFYKKYFHLFGKDYVEILNDVNSDLPENFNHSVIKLIPKNNKVKKSINDLRPISITNFEYRIFTKILANRLRLISDKMIGEHQTCSILSRRINDNINLLRDLILDANFKKIETYIVSLDQYKAFDSVSHYYLFKLINHIDFGKFINNSICRIYRNAYSYLVINNRKTDLFKIKSGIKQGCALSMILYIFVIEELFININLNSSISGYRIKITFDYQVKLSAYADDVVNVTTSLDSIKNLFDEFKKWSMMSGAKLNQNKTKIMALNSKVKEYDGIKFEEKINVLGVNFDKDGISSDNLDKVKSKIEQSVILWESAKISMIERVIVCKTFVLSKLWYIACFIEVPDDFIKKINTILFKYIWSGKCEMIKRDDLYLPYEQGGLSMVNVSKKIETILFQQFLYIIKNKEKTYYQFSIYWLKFKMFECNLKNFNIIPCGCDNKRPDIYKNIINSVDKMKKIEKSFILKADELNSKKTYNYFCNLEKHKSRLMSSPLQLDWKNILIKVHKESGNNELRSFNYKFLYEALPFSYKLKNKKVKCFLCNKYVDEFEHLFLNCEKTKILYKNVKEKYNFKYENINRMNISYNLNLSKNDFNFISVFKYSIWNLRNNIRIKNSINNIETIFTKMFNKWYISITNI